MDFFFFFFFFLPSVSADQQKPPCQKLPDSGGQNWVLRLSREFAELSERNRKVC